ncbi:hypothetical protein F4802DRAFT_197528 [Xylaria palmicola]|nr:hypothetical protein F4802DRAFT_197528 [Xylaria palmicola]
MSLSTQPPLDYSNNGPDIVISGSVFGFIATVVVSFRFWARRLTRQPLKLDNWLCLIALLFQHAVMASSAVGTINGGLGRDMRVVLLENPKSLVVLFQILNGKLEALYSNRPSLEVFIDVAKNLLSIVRGEIAPSHLLSIKSLMQKYYEDMVTELSDDRLKLYLELAVH